MSRYQVYQDSSQEWRWRLVDTNGETIAQGEGHPTEAGAKRALENVRLEARDAEVSGE